MFVIKQPQRKLRVLSLLLAIDENVASYNQFSRRLHEKHDITICTYFEPKLTPPKSITVLEGNGTVKQFLGNLKAAFQEKEFDVIHVHNPHTALMLLIACPFVRKIRVPKVYTVHNSYQNFRVRNKLMLIPTFGFFDRIVFCGEECAASYPRILKWLVHGKATVVQNGVDLERVRSVVDDRGEDFNDAPENSFSIISVGRLIEMKNPLTALRAFKEFNDEGATLCFLGEGPLRRKLASEIQKFDLGDCVHLMGLVPRDEVYKSLARADLFVSTSEGEGLPVAVLEAMSCKCPLILSDIPPHREIARGVDFIPLVSPNDVSGFAQEIHNFRIMPYARRAFIGRRCRDLVEKRFGLRKMLEGYEIVYRGTLRK